MTSGSEDESGSAAQDAAAERGGEDPRLARAARSIVVVARSFEQIGRSTGVSLPQYRLLLFLRHGPRRAGELAARVAIKRPTLTALVDGLEKEGRLRRVADERDGRGVRIELTDTGRAALRAIEAELAGLVDRLCSLGDREGLLGALDAFSEIVDAEFDRHVRESAGAPGERGEPAPDRNPKRGGH
jgi:DNA-binding MarR family transcriptional regulator